MRVLALFAVLLASTGARADSDVPDLRFERYTLDNGIEVILHQDERVPIVGVEVWYHVGSADEEAGQSGFAHLFEHMFKNSKHLGGRHHYAVLKSAGSMGANATTNPDRTNYYEIVPSNQLDLALWIESDRMGWFLPGLDGPRFERQREVVRNERRQNYDNRPYGRERFAVAAGLYQEGHPRRYLTIGRHEDLEVATLKMVRDFYKTWYVPANATLMVAGDFEIADAKQKIERWFGSYPASTKPTRRRVPPTPITRAVRTEVADPFAKLRRVHYAWHSPAQYQPGDAELDIVGQVLARDGTGRLYKRLVVEQQLAQSVGAYQWGADGNGEFHIVVKLQTGADQAAVEAIIDEEIERLRREPISEAELDRVVVAFEAGFIWGLESLRSRMRLLSAYNHYTGDPGYLPRDLERYRDARPEGIRGLVEHYLAPQKRVEVITIPAAGP